MERMPSNPVKPRKKNNLDSSSTFHRRAYKFEIGMIHDDFHSFMKNPKLSQL